MSLPEARWLLGVIVSSSSYGWMNGVTRICPKLLSSPNKIVLLSRPQFFILSTSGYDWQVFLSHYNISLHPIASWKFQLCESRDISHRTKRAGEYIYIGQTDSLYRRRMNYTCRYQFAAHTEVAACAFIYIEIWKTKKKFVHRITQRTHACSMLIRVFVGRNATVFFSRVIPLNAFSFCCRPFRNCRPWNRLVTLEPICRSSQLKRRTDLRFRSAARRTHTRTLREIKMGKRGTMIDSVYRFIISFSHGAESQQRSARCMHLNTSWTIVVEIHSLSIKIYF